MSFLCNFDIHDMKTVKTGKMTYTKTRRNTFTGNIVDKEENKDCVAVLRRCTKCPHEDAYLTDGFEKHIIDAEYLKTIEPFASFCYGEQGSVPNPNFKKEDITK